VHEVVRHGVTDRQSTCDGLGESERETPHPQQPPALPSRSHRSCPKRCQAQCPPTSRIRNSLSQGTCSSGTAANRSHAWSALRSCQQRTTSHRAGPQPAGFQTQQLKMGKLPGCGCVGKGAAGACPRSLQSHNAMSWQRFEPGTEALHQSIHTHTGEGGDTAHLPNTTHSLDDTAVPLVPTGNVDSVSHLHRGTPTSCSTAHNATR
jgi:hypothetical protein